MVDMESLALQLYNGNVVPLTTCDSIIAADHARFALPEIKSGIIADVLNPNQHILVQVVKEPISTKGPRLSAELSLAGRFMVLLPFSDRISISQKIEDSNEKERLKRLVQSITPKGFGVIIRTVASNKKVAELDSDLQQLVSRWRNLFNRIRKINKFPSKVLSEINFTMNKIQNRIFIKKLLNQAFKNYSG